MPTSFLADTNIIHLDIILGCALSIPVSTVAILLKTLLLIYRCCYCCNQVYNTLSKEKDSLSADSPMLALPQLDTNMLGLYMSKIYRKSVHSPSSNIGKFEIERSLSLGWTGLLPAYLPGMASKQQK